MSFCYRNKGKGGAAVSYTHLDVYKRQLQDGRRTVTEAAYEAGFNSLRSFDRAFAKQMKMTPVAYKRKLADGRDKGMGN